MAAPGKVYGSKSMRHGTFPELLLVLTVIAQAQWDAQFGEGWARDSARAFFASADYRHLFQLVQSCMPEAAHWADDTLPVGVAEALLGRL